MKIDSIAALLAFICLGIIVAGLVFGVTIYVNPNRSLDFVYAAQSNRDFRTAIGIWGVFTFWLAVFAFRKLFPKKIAQFLTFDLQSKLGILQILFILIAGALSVYIVL